MNCDLSMYDFIKSTNDDVDAEKLIYANNSFTFSQIISEVDKLAFYLSSKKGVKKGDSVAVCLPNIPQGIFAIYAISKLGAVANVVHPKMSAKALSRILAETNTKVLFAYEKLIPEYEKLIKTDNISIISCGADYYMKGLLKIIAGLMSTTSGTVVDYAEAVSFSGETESVGVGTEPAVYLHSSGTTGQPKTVVLSAFAFNALAKNILSYINKVHIHGIEDRMLMTLPLFHGFGLGVCVHLPISFMSVVLMPRFKAKEVFTLVKRHKITILAGVPSMFRKILNDKASKGTSLATLKELYSGGDKLSAELKKDFDDMLKNNGSIAELSEGYGLSEAASVATISTTGKTKYDSQGVALENVEIRIVNSELQEVTPLTIGELLIRSESMMLGYYNEPFDTLKCTYCDDKGKTWLRTGDSAYVDEDGYLFFKGRNKRSIKIGGVNVFPSEVEELVTDMKEIDDACAVRCIYEGKPALRLLVVLNPKFKLSILLEQKIKSLIESSIIKYAVPREIVAIDSIEKNDLGKVNYLAYEQNLQ